jgi:formate dehydrogenase iron-sulfur subunit
MKFEAAKRVKQLHDNGHADAGIYNPGDPDSRPGMSSDGSIGGTHVIYVLGDSKHPENYGGLPASPSVPLFVKLWKGPLKWIGGLGMVAGLAALFGHYVRYGPKPLHDEGDEGRRAQ